MNQNKSKKTQREEAVQFLMFTGCIVVVSSVFAAIFYYGC